MGKPRILIVDDEPNSRDTVQFSLEAAGCETATVADGSDALLAYGDGRTWDLVVLDEGLSDRDGLEILREFRQRRADARVLIVTAAAAIDRAVAAIDRAVAAMKLGAADVVCKPCDPDRLRACVHEILGRARAEGATVPAAGPAGRSTTPRVVLPPFSYVTLNGYQFWPIDLPPGGEETSALRIRRAFEIVAPDGEQRRCAVDVTTSVRELVQAEARRELPPPAPVWDTVCKGALSEHLWRRGEMPPAVLAVYDLNDRQQAAMRGVLGLTLPKRT
jgi:DNA-binding response OmpR family regulator